MAIKSAASRSMTSSNCRRASSSLPSRARQIPRELRARLLAASASNASLYSSSAPYRSPWLKSLSALMFCASESNIPTWGSGQQQRVIQGLAAVFQNIGLFEIQMRIRSDTHGGLDAVLSVQARTEILVALQQFVRVRVGVE